jgi:hypothetical protein
MKKLLLLIAVVAVFPLSASAGGNSKSVTLDVKDAEARVILKELQKQCGIRNLVIDPDVTGSGSFYFKEVPCETAFKVVLRTMDLQLETYSNNVVEVTRAKD